METKCTIGRHSSHRLCFENNKRRRHQVNLRMNCFSEIMLPAIFGRTTVSLRTCWNGTFERWTIAITISSKRFISAHDQRSTYITLLHCFCRCRRLKCIRSFTVHTINATFNIKRSSAKNMQRRWRRQRQMKKKKTWMKDRGKISYAFMTGVCTLRKPNASSKKPFNVCVCVRRAQMRLHIIFTMFALSNER